MYHEDFGFGAALKVWTVVCVIVGAGVMGILIAVVRFLGQHLGWRW
jgi:hypothetical protein